MQTLRAPRDQGQPHRTDAAIAAHNLNQYLVPIGELLTPSLLRRHSRFQNVELLLSESGLNPLLLGDLDPGMLRRLDDFTRLNTSFSDWASMLREARGQWVMRRMGIGIDA